MKLADATVWTCLRNNWKFSELMLPGHGKLKIYSYKMI